MSCNPSVTGTVVIPEHINGLPVTMIEGYAFRDCNGMTELIVPETVVTISSGVTAIGESAFRRCSSLTSVVIPDSVTSIGKYAFFYCENLTHLVPIPPAAPVSRWRRTILFTAVMLTVFCSIRIRRC